MDISKLNKFFFLYIILIFVIISCKDNLTKTYADKDCEIYISGKTGFWIEVFSESIKKENLVFVVDNKKILPEKILPTHRGISFFINEPIRLKDTVKILYNNEKYNLYNFTNISETVIDGSNHKKVNICRVSTATINGKDTDDNNNNILKLKLK